MRVQLDRIAHESHRSITRQKLSAAGVQAGKIRGVLPLVGHMQFMIVTDVAQYKYGCHYPLLVSMCGMKCVAMAILPRIHNSPRQHGEPGRVGQLVRPFSDGERIGTPIQNRGDPHIAVPVQCSGAQAGRCADRTVAVDADIIYKGDFGQFVSIFVFHVKLLF